MEFQNYSKNNGQNPKFNSFQLTKSILNMIEELERNKKRDGKERIPEPGIRAVHVRLELPAYQEGFDKLYYVSIDEHENFIVEDWQDEV